MISKEELKRAFGGKPFVTKGQVRDAMGYSSYNEIRQFFQGLEHIGQKYLMDDVVKRVMEFKEFGE